MVLIYLNKDYAIPPTSLMWERHHQLETPDQKCIHLPRMVAYKELSHVHGNVIVRNYVIPIQIEKFIISDNGDRVYIAKYLLKCIWFMVHTFYI